MGFEESLNNSLMQGKTVFLTVSSLTGFICCGKPEIVAENYGKSMTTSIIILL
jgi:hypothetical protein